jgi:hypothetical protein
MSDRDRTELDGDAQRVRDHVQDHHERVRVIIGSGKCRPGPNDVAPDTIFLQKPYPLERLVREVRPLAST